jgi:anti-anti-sigma factor
MTDLAPSAAELYVEAGASGHVTTLRLTGTLNLYTAPILAVRLDEALKCGAWHVVLTLAKLEDMAAEEGVGALLRALRRVQAGHGTLLLAEVPDMVRRAIRTRGLGLVLPAFPTEDAAVGFLTSCGGAA